MKYIYVLMVFLFMEAQDYLFGLPKIKTFNEEMYQAHQQNFDISFDRFGYPYIGNRNGILKYNNKDWELIRTENNAYIMAVEANENGRIFAGGYGDFGYLEKDSVGKDYFVSLVKYLPKEKRQFNRISQIVVIDHNVFFLSQKFLYLYRNKHITAWTAEDNKPFISISKVDKKLYIHKRNDGLYELTAGSLNPVDQQFSDEKYRIQSIQKLKNNNFFISCMNTGFYSYNPKTKKIKNNFNHEINNSVPYRSGKLNDSTIVSATLKGGLLFFNTKNEFLYRITEKDGISSGSLLSAKIDMNGDLWITSFNGISFLQYNSAFRFYDKNNGLDGSIEYVRKAHGNLYLASVNGLYYRNFKSKDYQFKKINNLDFWISSPTKFKKHLLAVGNNKVLSINKSHKVNYIDKGRKLYISGYFKNRIYYINGNNKLVFREYNEGIWNPVKELNNHNLSNIRSIMEDYDGNLWMANGPEPVIRINKEYWVQDYSDNQVNSFGEVEGLKSISVNNLFTDYKGRIMLATNKGPYLFSIKNQKFKPDTLLRVKLSYFKNPDLSIASNGRDKLWINNRITRQNAYLAYNDSGYQQLVWEPFTKLKKYTLSGFFDDGKNVWFCGNKRLIHFNTNHKQSINTEFYTTINRVKLENDSNILFNYSEKSASINLPYKFNTINFEFTNNRFGTYEDSRYQYQLINHDKSWSDWSTVQNTRYSELSEGSYLFQVRSKDNLGTLSKITEISFIIAAPWYRTWYMYSVYIFTVILLIYLLIRYRLLRERKLNEQLKRIVREKTEDLNEKNIVLKKQSEDLKELDQIKSNFFVSLSHEFKTPLTLILAPINQIFKKRISGNRINVDVDDLKIIDNNASRLHNLVIQLMDLSKLDHKNLAVVFNTVDLNILISKVITENISYMKAKKIDVEFQAEDGNIFVTDVEKLKTIIGNLIFNAIKFSYLGGTISIRLRKEDKCFTISVKDNGIGISPENVDRVFQRFYQENIDTEDQYSGTGIGLSLSKELIELIGGTIRVISKHGQGSEFIIEHPYLQGEYPVYECPTQKRIEARQNRQREYITEKFRDTKILIVDDNTDFLKFTEKALNEREYQVFLATNGKEALEQTKLNKPDLIITDIMMPYKDGVELCKELKSNINSSHIPIIIITASTNQSQKLDLISLGIDAYLMKPFDLEELELQISSILKKHENLKEKYRNSIFSDNTELLNSTDEDFIKTVIDIIKREISNSTLSVDTLLQELTISRSVFYHKMKILLNMSPNELIRKVRLESASKMIKNHIGSISEIAYKVGFNSPSYFAECFRKEFGHLPSKHGDLIPVKEKLSSEL